MERDSSSRQERTSVNRIGKGFIVYPYDSDSPDHQIEREGRFFGGTKAYSTVGNIEIVFWVGQPLLHSRLSWRAGPEESFSFDPSLHSPKSAFGSGRL